LKLKDYLELVLKRPNQSLRISAKNDYEAMFGISVGESQLSDEISITDFKGRD